MTNLQMSELHKLSVKDKIEVVQSLWDDIAEEQSIGEFPEAHQKILDERIKKIAEGEAIYKPWSEIQQKFAER
jgi:putative addiction module component (TIGR02574 family)